MGQCIGIVDDDKDILGLLSAYLREQGYDTVTAENGEELRTILREQHCDLLVLDVMLPGDDGFALCRELRAQSAVPIVFLSALGNSEKRVQGLELGADDYITKPFDPRELLARIRAVLRRTHSGPDLEQVRYMSFGGWLLNTAGRCLESPNKVLVHLSGAEFRLLMVFLAQPHKVLSREILMEATQGRTSSVFDRSIDVQVSRLRNRLRVNNKAMQLIKTVRGDGYLLASEVLHHEQRPDMSRAF